MKARALAALWMCAAASASAAPRRLDVRLTSGRSVFTQVLGAEEGRPASFSGRVAGTGGAVRSLVVNASLSGSSLEYQVELTGGRGSSLPSLQAQGTVLLRPGARLQALECGAWTLEFGLDAGRRKPAQIPPKPDEDGLDNERLSVELVNGRKPLKCRFVTKDNAQTNIVDSAVIGGRKSGFIFNGLLARRGGVFSLQYQLEDSRPGLSPVQLQSEASLASGRKTSVPGRGYQLDFLAESPTPSARAR